MFSLVNAGRRSLRSLPSTRRTLATAAATPIVNNPTSIHSQRNVPHHLSGRNPTSGGPQVDLTAHGLPSQPLQTPPAYSDLAKTQFTKSIQQQVQRNTEHSDFYHAVAKISKIRERYIKDRTVFVRGEEMYPILLGLGATPEDIAAIPSTSDRLGVDPTMPFRTSANSRWCFDYDTKSIRRLEHQPFLLSEDEDFKRWDSGQVRTFPPVSGELGMNTAFIAVLLFKAMMVHGMNIAKRHNLNYDINKWVCIAFSVRTHTTQDLVGEPALEGVHSDGADHTLVTLLGSDNMTKNSAATFLHDMDEVTGTPLSEASALKIVGRNRHSEFLDTMMIVDHERKHSLTSVHAEDPARKAQRDVLIFFTRKPYMESHPASSIDSLTPHPTLGVERSVVDMS